MMIPPCCACPAKELLNSIRRVGNVVSITGVVYAIDVLRFETVAAITDHFRAGWKLDDRFSRHLSWVCGRTSMGWRSSGVTVVPRRFYRRDGGFKT
jgi:hypothetical protein